MTYRAEQINEVEVGRSCIRRLMKRLRLTFASPPMPNIFSGETVRRHEGGQDCFLAVSVPIHWCCFASCSHLGEPHGLDEG